MIWSQKMVWSQKTMHLNKIDGGSTFYGAKTVSTTCCQDGASEIKRWTTPSVVNNIIASALPKHWNFRYLYKLKGRNVRFFLFQNKVQFLIKLTTLMFSVIRSLK